MSNLETSVGSRIIECAVDSSSYSSLIHGRWNYWQILFRALTMTLVVITPSIAAELTKPGVYEESTGHFQLQGDVIPIAEDGIHDPHNEATRMLQPPAEAMLNFPRDDRGVINWVEALDDGIIDPRTSIDGDEKMHAVDFDVIFENTASMPYVRFPHRPHTIWLTCQNCHPAIFIPQRGSNPVTMAAIMKGEYCGVCHGKVAFPPYECKRCHREARKSVGLRYK